MEDIVLDKTSSNIMFAVVGFGGLMGAGEKFHPAPWSSLDFDESENYYVLNMTRDQIKAAPADSIDALTRGNGTALRDTAYEFHGAQRYWS